MFVKCEHTVSWTYVWTSVYNTSLKSPVTITRQATHYNHVDCPVSVDFYILNIQNDTENKMKSNWKEKNREK